MSQRQLAQRMGLASSTISRYEQDLVTPSDGVLTRLADFFQVDVKIFHQSVKGAVSTIHYVSNQPNALPMKVRHKLEADLQTQVECWEAFENLVGKKEPVLDLNEHPFFLAITNPDQINKRAASIRRVWFDSDVGTDDLTAFIERTGYRILISSESDSRFVGLIAQSKDNDYFLISTAWSDEKRRYNLATMLGMRLLLALPSISPTRQRLKSFAMELLNIPSSSARTPNHNESTPQFGINVPMPDLGSQFAQLVNASWRKGFLSTQTAISLLRSTEEDLREMPTLP